jgi:hypothetical protein
MGIEFESEENLKKFKKISEVLLAIEFTYNRTIYKAKFAPARICVRQTSGWRMIARIQSHEQLTSLSLHIADRMKFIFQRIVWAEIGTCYPFSQ